EFDFTRDKLAWTKLDFEPLTLTRMGGKGGSAGLDALGTVMKFLGALMGLKPNFAVEPRGFLGAELVEIDSRLSVKKVLPNGPAADAGLRVGDWIKKVGNDSADSLESFAKHLGKLTDGAKLALTVTREGKDILITVELGKGL